MRIAPLIGIEIKHITTGFHIHARITVNLGLRGVLLLVWNPWDVVKEHFALE